AGELGEFTMADVLDRLADKMIRRHPHVFGDRVVADAREALAQWERIKHDEGDGAGGPRSALDGVPNALPALLRAQRLQAKEARAEDLDRVWEAVKARERGGPRGSGTE